MKFELINPKNENGFIKSIDFNFDELKKELETKLEKYNNLTYSEEQLKEAKEDKSGLNKFRTAIETRRKEIKNLCLKPYNDFEIKIKELTGLIDKPILAIDSQLKNFEEMRITAKRADITDFYNSSIDDLKELLPLEKIFNDKWLNSTYKMSNIQKEIIEIIGKTNGDLKVITDLQLDPDMDLQVKDKYLQTLDFGVAMAEKTRLENIKTAIKARENMQEEQIHQDEPKPLKMDEETGNKIENSLDIKNEVIENEKPKICECKFWVKGTKEQLLDLREFLKDKNIEYGGF